MGGVPDVLKLVWWFLCRKDARFGTVLHWLIGSFWVARWLSRHMVCWRPLPFVVFCSVLICVNVAAVGAQLVLQV